MRLWQRRLRYSPVWHAGTLSGDATAPFLSAKAVSSEGSTHLITMYMFDVHGALRMLLY